MAATKQGERYAVALAAQIRAQDEREREQARELDQTRRMLYELLHDIYGPNPKYRLIEE